MPAPPLSLRIHRFAQYPLFVLILFCRAPTSPHNSHVSTFCRLYSSWQCRGAHFPALSFHVEQRLCRPPKPQCLSAFWLFMHIYASYFMLCTALRCQPCRFATILFRRCRLPLAAKTDLSLRQSLCIFSCNRRPRSSLLPSARHLHPLRSTRQSICFLL